MIGAPAALHYNTIISARSIGAGIEALGKLSAGRIASQILTSIQSKILISDVGVSGAKESRPAFSRLMADAHRWRFAVLLLWKIDRYGQSLRHLVMHSPTSTPPTSR
ncbi:MAG: hypothetical protein C5B58_10485, partial [Acidobacteria bacterium]